MCIYSFNFLVFVNTDLLFITFSVILVNVQSRSFQEILSDPSQLDFFKHYLVKEKEETPLLFWVAVESMRTTTKNAIARQGRALGIVKRFFGAATNQGEIMSLFPLKVVQFTY